jgi:CRP-like cAMP-binding protein
MSVSVEVLAQHPFLQGIPPQLLSRFTECANVLSFEPGEYLFIAGQTADRFLLVLEGNIAVSANGGDDPHTLYTRGAGDALGWSWAFSDYHWRFTGKATSRVRVLSFNGPCLRNRCDSDLALGYEFMKRLSGHLLHALDDTRLQVLDMFQNG